MREKSETYIEGLEEERIKAFESRNAREYFLLCEDLGINPEAEDLYKQGQLEVELDRSKEEQTSLLEKSTKYTNFLKGGSRLNVRNFTNDAESKKRLLKTHFPGRFGENGTQSLENLTDGQIGSLFQKLMEYSEKESHQ